MPIQLLKPTIAVQVPAENIKGRVATKAMRSHGKRLADWIRQERIPPPLAMSVIVDPRDASARGAAGASLRFIFALCLSVWFHVSPYPLYCGTVNRPDDGCTWSILGKYFQLYAAAARRDRVWLVGVESFRRRARNMVFGIAEFVLAPPRINRRHFFAGAQKPHAPKTILELAVPESMLGDDSNDERRLILLRLLQKPLG